MEFHRLEKDSVTIDNMSYVYLEIYKSEMEIVSTPGTVTQFKFTGECWE